MIDRRQFGIDEDDLLMMYEVLKMTEQQIADCYGCSRWVIHDRLKEITQPRTKSEAARIYSINEDFFKEWIPESAWMYGWSVGDGNYITSDTLRFKLARQDKEVLYKFKQVLDSEHPVKDYEEWNKVYQKYYEMSTIAFSSQKLVNNLRKLSYLDEYLTAYYDHFVRGIFEAEGSVYFIHNGRHIQSDVTNNKELLEYIWDFLKGAGVVEGGSIRPKSGCWELRFGHYDSVSFYHFMYDDCGELFLKRKKEKFEDLLIKLGD